MSVKLLVIVIADFKPYPCTYYWIQCGCFMCSGF